MKEVSQYRPEYFAHHCPNLRIIGNPRQYLPARAAANGINRHDPSNPSEVWLLSVLREKFSCGFPYDCNRVGTDHTI